MPETRHEIILRLPNIAPVLSERIVRSLTPLARNLSGSLSVIEREHHADHAIHKTRKKII